MTREPLTTSHINAHQTVVIDRVKQINGVWSLVKGVSIDHLLYKSEVDVKYRGSGAREGAQSRPIMPGYKKQRANYWAIIAGIIAEDHFDNVLVARPELASLFPNP